MDETGRSFVKFTSFISLDVRNEGKALSYPIELGSFANYNKVQSPLDIRVSLAIQGTETEFQDAILRLNKFQKEAEKLYVVTHGKIYENMTLESYSYTRKADRGAYLLIVDLDLVEVREVATQVTTTVISKPRNPTSASKKDEGQKNSSAMNDIQKNIAAGRDWFYIEPR